MNEGTIELDPQQRQAATFGLDTPGLRHPPLRIAAGAGTGKTTTLAHRVAELILAGADPARILLLTFTRRAAEELASRVAAICRDRLGRRIDAAAILPWSGTFHAMALRLVREQASVLGLDPSFGVLDRIDARDLLDQLRRELGFADGRVRFPPPALCLEIGSFTLNAAVPLAQALAWRWPHLLPLAEDLRRLFAAFAASKTRFALLDYDDLLLALATMLDHPALGERLRRRFDHLLVDEYQDTTPLQARIVRGFLPDGRGLTVVGDDQQAIYGFRAASVRNMLDFPRMFPQAQTCTLTTNRRSSQPILALANAILAEAREGIPKRLVGGIGEGPRPQLVVVADEAAQARAVVARVLAFCERGVRLRHQAVLVRSVQHMAWLELELGRRRIPYRKYGGLKLLEAAHVRDFFAFLRHADNPRDRLSGERMLCQLPGVGRAFATLALDRLEGSDFDPLALALLPPPASARSLWADFLDLLVRLRTPGAWPDCLETLRAFLVPLLERRYADHAERGRDLEQLVLAARTFPTRRDFLAALALEPPVGSGGEAADPRRHDDWLVLSTIHSAKGREFEVVFVPWLVDGWIPSDLATGSAAEIEEERRLFYVAVTRARRRLVLLRPLVCYLHSEPGRSDHHVRALPSRFLTPRLLAELELVTGEGEEGGRTADERSEKPGGEPAKAGMLLDLAASLRAMWRRGPA